jgi:sugar phosphate isomerase/epimerase
MRIRIGNQTSIHAHEPNRPYEFALRSGFDAFEWFSDKGIHGWTEADVGADARRQLRQSAREHDVLFSVHAPHQASPLDADGAAAIRRSIDFAADVAAAVVNVHLFTDAGPEAYAEALMPLVRHARRFGVRLSVENVPATTPDDFNAVFTALSRHPECAGVVGMCLEMGHANLCPATRNDYLGYVDRLGPQVPIIHWHAHENWGDRDSHLPLFTGPSARDEAGVRGLIERLKLRGFNGSVVLEQWPEPPQLLVRVRDRLRTLFGLIS